MNVSSCMASLFGRLRDRRRHRPCRRPAARHGGLDIQALEPRFALAAGPVGSVTQPLPSGTGFRALAAVVGPADAAGNTAAAARSIGVSASTALFQDWVGATDTDDFYRFAIAGTSDVALQVTGLTADADVQLRGADGTTVIASSTQRGTASEAIARQLPAGTYFIRVYPNAGATNYTLGVAAAPTDFAGNTPATARTIAVGPATATFDDWVGPADPDDYYRFTVATTADVNLQVTGLVKDADVQLRAADGTTVIATSSQPGVATESIARRLSAGTYFVRVYPFDGTTTYSLRVTAAPSDLAGNTPAAARAIALGPTAASFTDWVGPTDTDDYYSFSLPGTSDFRLQLTGLSADADVILYDANADWIAASTRGGTTAETISRQLPAGRYVVRVYQMAGATPYTLSASAAPVLPPDGAGNTPATARVVTVGSTKATFQDWVGSQDRNDFYRFTLAAASNFNAQLFGLLQDADAQLLGADGTTVLATSAAKGAASESIALSLAAGTYYVRIYQFDRDTGYSLSFVATPAALPDSAGDTLAAARVITVEANPATYRDWVGAADSSDYYRFTITGAAQVTATLGGLSGDADLTLLDGAGATIVVSSNANSAGERVSRTLAAGTYYLLVSRFFGDTFYDLTVSTAPVVPPDFAGNTPATARAIAVGATPTTVQDWVGLADTDDYYRLAFTNFAALKVDVTGLLADADIALLDGNGAVISSSTASGTTAESLSRVVVPGAYFLRVYRFRGDTTYSFTVSATPSDPPPTPPGTDWFSLNLRDPELVALTRSLAQDGSLSRADMIAIFRNTSDGNTVDANELADLQTIVSNSNRFAMAETVWFLSGAIANGSTANVNSGIGNLAAGSRPQQLEALIGKWFLGTDRPTTQYAYTPVSGSLFQNGPGLDDINQNALGDCYFLCSLSAIAQKKPQLIRDMFTDNGDNTWTVRFYNNGVPEYVTVDNYLPAVNGYQIYAGWGGGLATSSANELWVPLAEKAYAQVAESGWSRPGLAVNAYSVIEGGWMDKVIQQVTALPTTMREAPQMTEAFLIGLVNSNFILTAGFVSGAGFGVVNSHAYSIQYYTPAGSTFRLRNPWATTHADVTFAQLQSLKGVIVWSNV